MRRSLILLNTTLMIVLFLTNQAWAQATDSSGVSTPDSAASAINIPAPDSVTVGRPAADTTTTAESNPDSMPTPLVEGPVKVAVVVQDSTEMRWDAAYFPNTGATVTRRVEFMAGKATGCAELNCYLAAANDDDAKLLLLINRQTNQVSLYDPASGDKLGEAELDNPFSVFAAVLGGEFALPETLLPTIPDSLMADSLAATAAEMDSLAAEALAAAQVAVRAKPETPSAVYRFTNYDKVLYRHLRTFGAFVENPSQLALKHETSTAWSLILPLPFIPLRMRMSNSVLTPGWVKTWFRGQYLTENDKQQMTGVLRGKMLDIHTLVDFPTVLGVRIGPVGFNTGIHLAVKGTLPGNLLMLPWSDFTSDNPLTNLNLNFETLNYSQTSIGYGRVIPTPLGAVRAGAGLGFYFGYGYGKLQSEQFTLATCLDSVVVDFVGRGYFTDPKMGLLSEANTANMDLGDFPGSPGFGLNLGAGMDLYPLTGQHLDVQIALSNIGAKLTWNHVTEKTFSAHAVIYNVADVMDNASDSTYIDSLLNPTETIIGTGRYSVSIPTRLALVVQYQPIPLILIQASYRQNFSGGAVWTTDPQLGLYVGLFPKPVVEFRGALNYFLGQTAWSGGFGLHFKHYELGFDMTAINGMSLNASGFGVQLTQALYF